MPPRTKNPEGTAYSRRKEYLRDQLRQRVPHTEIDNFVAHTLKVAEDSGMRMPANRADFARRIGFFRSTNGPDAVGLSGWSLDVLEAGLVRWDAKPVKLSVAETNEAMIDDEARIPVPDFDPTVPPERPPAPLDLLWLMEAVPALDAMPEVQRHSALNYLRDRYYSGRGMTDA